MSLKLDELRKRLLQQQSGSDGGAPDPSSSVGNGKVLNIVPPRAVEAASAPRVAEEPAAAASVREVPAATKASEPPVESKMPAPEPLVVSVVPKPSEASVSE